MASEITHTSDDGVIVRLRLGEYVQGERPRVLALSIDSSERPITSGDLAILGLFGIDLDASPNGNGTKPAVRERRRVDSVALPEFEPPDPAPDGDPSYRNGHSVRPADGDVLTVRPKRTRRTATATNKRAYQRRPPGSEFAGAYKKFNGDRGLLCDEFGIDGRKLSAWITAYRKDGAIN